MEHRTFEAASNMLSGVDQLISQMENTTPFGEYRGRPVTACSDAIWDRVCNERKAVEVEMPDGSLLVMYPERYFTEKDGVYVGVEYSFDYYPPEEARSV